MLMSNHSHNSLYFETSLVSQLNFLSCLIFDSLYPTKVSHVAGVVVVVEGRGKMKRELKMRFAEMKKQYILFLFLDA